MLGPSFLDYTSIRCLYLRLGIIRIYVLRRRCSILRLRRLVLRRDHNVEAVEEDGLHASPEVLLVAEEDLVEVPHPAHEHAVVDVQLVEPAGQLGPTTQKMYVL